MLTKKYLTNYIHFWLSRFVAGQKNYEQWKEKNYSLRTAVIKNRQLARELEKVSKEKGGVLTYAEYLQVEQDGIYGYHATHNLHGMTPVFQFLGLPLATFANQYDLHHIVEFGCGDGLLGVEIIKAAKANGWAMTWQGIEINAALADIAKSRFEKARISDAWGGIVPAIQSAGIPEKSLFLFSYSLDSVAPEVFFHTKSERGVPDGMLGLQIHEGVLQEIILTDTVLEKKGVSLRDGIYTDQKNRQYDISSWQLYHGQRAFIPVQSFGILVDFINTIPEESRVLIIDEFARTPAAWETNHLCLPKDLYVLDRVCQQIEKYYQTAGETLFYYPGFVYSYKQILQSLGMTDIHSDEQMNFAESLLKRARKDYSFSLCFAIQAKKEKQKTAQVLTVAFPDQNKQQIQRAK